MRLGSLAAVVVACLAGTSGRAAPREIDRFLGEPIVEVQIVSDGVRVASAAVAELVETRVGEPLSLRQVRESLTHLYSLGGYGGIGVGASALRGGVALLYELRPLEVIDRVEFSGRLGLSKDDLQQAVARTPGAAFDADTVEAVVERVRDYYRARGFLTARVDPRLEGPRARRVLRLDIAAGRRATVGMFQVRGILPSRTGFDRTLTRLGLRAGMPYDGVEFDRRLADYERELRQRAFYEASLRHVPEFSDDGDTVSVLLDIQQGPRVTVAFAGDDIPGADVAQLVPVEREASVDEDLLEDAGRRIVAHLRGLGYRDAAVTHERSTTGTDLSIVFTVARGTLYRVANVVISGNESVDDAVLVPLVTLAAGAPLVLAELDAGLAAVVQHYNRLGFATAGVSPVCEELTTGGDAGSVAVACVLEITEGVRTTIRSIAFDGTDAWGPDVLGAAIGATVGAPYDGPVIDDDRSAILELYLNEGYEQATVAVEPRFEDDLRAVDLVFRVREGPQVLVNHILVVGNQQVNTATIRGQLTLAPGAPLGLDDVAETLRRLNALGMFRNLDIREFSHGRDDRRDVIVEVEEAPATRLAYGGGLEVSQRLRRETDVAGSQAVERIEFARRGFFEIGRRNLFGRNRSIDLFTRVSVRRKNDPIDPLRLDGATAFGFNEYRILSTYREPRTFGLGWDVLFQGYIEQAIRPGFDLFSRGITAQLSRQISPTARNTLAYRLGNNDTSNKELNREDEDIVDRLFPNVRLSSFSASHVRDTTDDPFEPTRGSLVGFDTEIAARAIGSAVGFGKTSASGSVYRALPGTRRVVVAAGARIGLAWGFPRSFVVMPETPGRAGPPPSIVVPLTDPALPISERFFAGGDRTVRGFALDRLGDPVGQTGGTIDHDGFPQGGNAMILLNSELRFRLTGAFGLVTFLDAGNVYDRVQHMSLARIRGGAGFGVRYASPIGPIAVDLGFKLGERYVFGSDQNSDASPTQEPLTALHISIGQAF